MLNQVFPPSLDPITGDIEVTYRYPAYTKRDPRTLSGTGGELRAPRGTEVRLVTRADRVVKAAELVVEMEGAARAEPKKSSGGAAGQPAAAAPEGKTLQHVALAVENGRGLSGRFVLDGAGSYRFRYLDAKSRLLAEGPPIPIAIEPDAFPQARIVAPARELEVDAGAVVDVEWQAEDDFGLSEVALVLKPPAGPDQRRILRKGDGLRRDGGTQPLALAAEHLVADRVAAVAHRALRQHHDPERQDPGPRLSPGERPRRLAEEQRAAHPPLSNRRAHRTLVDGRRVRRHLHGGPGAAAAPHVGGAGTRPVLLRGGRGIDHARGRVF